MAALAGLAGLEPTQSLTATEPSTIKARGTAHYRQAIRRPAAPLGGTPIMTATTELAPLLYTVEEALSVLRMARSSFYREVKAGRIRIVKQGTATRVTAGALAAYVALLEQEAENVA